MKKVMLAVSALTHAVAAGLGQMATNAKSVLDRINTETVVPRAPRIRPDAETLKFKAREKRIRRAYARLSHAVESNARQGCERSRVRVSWDATQAITGERRA